MTQLFDHYLLKWFLSRCWTPNPGAGFAAGLLQRASESDGNILVEYAPGILLAFSQHPVQSDDPVRPTFGQNLIFYP